MIERAGIGLTLALAGATPAAGQERVALDLVTHSEVMIERPAASIWPYILEPGAWKRGATLRHHSGPIGAVGEVFAAVEPGSPSDVAFFVVNVELVAGRRRTIKLLAPGGALIGYASWTLRETGSRTSVAYDVYSETRLAPEQAAALTPDQRRDAERATLEASQNRFDLELQELKRLVEAEPR